MKSPTGSQSAPAPDLAALSPWAPELARTFVSLASDIALVIDPSGVIRNVAQGSTEPLAAGADKWVGRPWIDTVSGETRPKIETLLREVSTTGIARRREVNHPFGDDRSVPVAYTAIRLGNGGPVLAVGRDLRTVAAIQQRYVESQQDMERGYWQARQAESRYRLLFQVATDGVLVVDAQTSKVLDANDAAARMLGAAPEQLLGRLISAGFEHHSRLALQELLSSAGSGGSGGEIRARLQGSQAASSVVATPFRSEGVLRVLVRLRPLNPGAADDSLNRGLSRFVDSASDGIVVTDASGRVQSANPAFLSLLGMAREADLKGQPLTQWLSVQGQALAGLVARVRRDGIARAIAASVRRPGATAVPIEITAALLAEEEHECIGFLVHPLAQGAHATTNGAAAPSVLAALHSGLDSLAGHLGERDLAQMVREAAALAERQFVQLAIERCGGDVGRAAVLLGLSREALALRLGGSGARDTP